jgi:hypothetical protein
MSSEPSPVIVNISEETHRVLKSLSTYYKATMRSVVTMAMDYYKELWKGREIEGNGDFLPTIHPMVYPRPSSPIHIQPADKSYLDRVTSKQLGNHIQNLDTIIVTFQNNHSMEIIPTWLRVPWLDSEYTEWLRSLPREFR